VDGNGSILWFLAEGSTPYVGEVGKYGDVSCSYDMTSDNNLAWTKLGSSHKVEGGMFGANHSASHPASPLHAGCVVIKLGKLYEEYLQGSMGCME
jgi:hypothetical protein